METDTQTTLALELTTHDNKQKLTIRNLKQSITFWEKRAQFKAEMFKLADESRRHWVESFFKMRNRFNEKESKLEEVEKEVEHLREDKIAWMDMALRYEKRLVENDKELKLLRQRVRDQETEIFDLTAPKNHSK